MNKSRLLMILVVANVLCAFGSVGAEAFFGWTLPPVLAQYEQARFSGFSMASPTDVFRALLVATTSLIAFAAWIGLVTFWRHARGFYLFSLATSIVLVLFGGADVRTSVGSAFGALDAMVAGLIVGLVYFSDLARRFERAPARVVSSSATGLSADRA